MEVNDILDDNLFKEKDNKESVNSITPTQFFVLFFCSVGLYAIWWMYKAWKFFQKKDNLDIMPAARAFFGILFMYSLFERIQNYAHNTGYTNSYSSGGLFGWALVTNLMSRLPDPFWLVSLLSVFSYIHPLKAFNSAIDNSDEYKLIDDNGFNTRQIILIVLGLILWSLIIIGLLVPEGEF